MGYGQPPHLPPPEIVAAKNSVHTWGCIVPVGAVGFMVGIGIVWIVGLSNQLSHGFDFHGSKNPVGCTSSPPPYPDRQPTDCVAAATDPTDSTPSSIGIGDAWVFATWSRSTDNLGTASICAAIHIINLSDSTISYSDHYWSLQTPGGIVANANSVATGGLGSGVLGMAGMASGSVCFDDSGQTGTYVGIYKNPLNPARGIWLVPLT